MESTDIWLLAAFIVWLGCISSFCIYAMHKGWVEPGIFQSLNSSQLYRLTRALWVLTLLIASISVAAFIYLETNLIFKGFPYARVRLKPDEYKQKLKEREDSLIQGLELLGDRVPAVMLNEKEDLEERLAEVDLDYSRYVGWIRSQIYQLEALKNFVSIDLLIKARKALAEDTLVEADLYLEQIEKSQRAQPAKAARIASMRGRLARWRVDYEKAYAHAVHAAMLMENDAGLYKEAGLMAYYVADYQKSLDYYEAALSLDIRDHGEGYSGIAIDYTNLGKVRRKLEDYQKALEHYERALSINVKNYGDKHPSVADNHYDVGFAFAELEEYREAISHFEQGLSIDLELHEQNDPRTVRHYEGLGWAWGRLKDYRKAIQYYEKALAGNLKTYGEDHVEVAEQQSNLGWAWANLGEYSMSEIYYKYALDNYLKNYGENHPLVMQARRNLKGVDRLLREKTKTSQSASRRLR